MNIFFYVKNVLNSVLSELIKAFKKRREKNNLFNLLTFFEKNSNLKWNSSVNQKSEANHMYSCN